MMITNRQALWIIFCMAALLAATLTGIPKGYAEPKITALDAAQLGLAHIETLISAKKLDSGWATHLTAVQVSVRNVKGFAEYVVQMSRSSGTPASLTVYYNMDGAYSGSSAGPGEGKPGSGY